MLGTEREVSTKLCPMTLGGSNPATCIGARCAGWRWAKGYNSAYVCVPPASDWPAPVENANVGFCGLAGKPEIA